MTHALTSNITWLETSLGYWIGGRRRLASVQKGFKERNGCDRKSHAEQFYFNVVGACGEISVAKLTGRYWLMGINQRKDEPDVAPDIQVRTLESIDYDLIVRPDDPDHFRYVLVLGEPPEFTIPGWIWGHEAKLMEDRLFDRGNRNNPAFWIPQDRLHNPSELIT